MGVPGGPAMDPFVDDFFAHDGSGELWRIDAHQQDVVFFPPCDELVGKQGRMAELDSEFVCAGFLDEVL